jgi:hypothetical protein
MKHLLVDIYQVCSNKSPRSKLTPPQGVFEFPYLYIVKTLKIFLWKSKKARAYIFCKKHVLVAVYQVCLTESPRVKIGPAPGVIDFPYMYIVKIWKSFLWKSKSTIDKIYGMKHLLVDFYQVCSKKCLRVKIGPAPGGHWFSLYIHVCIKNLKNLKQVELRYLAWNVFLCMSTMFVKIKTLGSKLTRPKGIEVDSSIPSQVNVCFPSLFLSSFY